MTWPAIVIVWLVLGLVLAPVIGSVMRFGSECDDPRCDDAERLGDNSIHSGGNAA